MAPLSTTCIVHKLSDNDYLLVINAGTREKDVQWVRSQVGRFPGIHISDYSDYVHATRHPGPARGGDAGQADHA